MPRRSRGIAQLLGWAAVYTASALLIHLLALPTGAELGLGMVLLLRLSSSSLVHPMARFDGWPGALSLLLGSLLVRMAEASQFVDALTIAICITASSLLATRCLSLVRREVPLELLRVRDFLSLLFAAFVGCIAFSGLAIVLEALLGQPTSAGDSPSTPASFAGALSSAISLAVFALSLGRKIDGTFVAPWAKWAELAVATLVTLGAAQMLRQGSSAGYPLTVITTCWMALRFGMLGASTALLSNLISWTPAALPSPALMLAVWSSLVFVAAAAAEDWQRRMREHGEARFTHEALTRAWPLPIATVNLEGRILTWNAAAEQLFGYQSSDVRGQHSPIVPAERQREFQELCARLLRGETAPPVVSWRKRKDGTLIPVRIRASAIEGPQGQMTGVLGLFEDLTEQQRSDAAREQLAGILRATTDFVGMADPNCRLTYVNAAGRRMLGFAENDDLTDLSLAELIPDPFIGSTFEKVFPTAARDGVWSGEMALRHRDGHSIPVSQLVLAHHASDGKLQFYSMISRDLRDRIEAESALRATEGQLRQAQKMEAIGRLAGGIAHDFNNLLTIMIGFSEMALSKLGAEHPAERDMQEVRNSAERAAALTRQLLTFSRKQEGEKRVFDLNSLLPNLDTMLKRLLGERIQVVQNHASEAAYVRADQSQLEQVVLNLAVNARDAMPDGGVMTIETALVELGTNMAPAFEGGDEVAAGSYVRLTVQDTGTGMSSETLAHIFEPFFTTKEPGKGTGLGLATVYGIVKQGGGFVQVKSVEQQGSSFNVYLPRVSQSGEQVSSQTQARVSRGGRETILLVEDESAVRELARQILGGRGYHVLVAPDAESALAISRRYEGRIDMLLTDVVMPDKPGPLLARELVQERANLRVLFMSGYAGDALLAITKLDSQTNLLNKPFLPNALLQRVREILDTAKPHARMYRVDSGARR